MKVAILKVWPYFATLRKAKLWQDSTVLNYRADLTPDCEKKKRLCLVKKLPLSSSPHLLSQVFHHDNAPAHTCVVTTAKLVELRYAVMAHPAYSSDLAPSSFFLFHNLKKVTCRRKLWVEWKSYHRHRSQLCRSGENVFFFWRDQEVGGSLNQV